MKILIFSVLVLVCIQFCSANLDLDCLLLHNCNNNCSVQLDQLNANATAFIAEFKQLHDATHTIADTAFQLCLTLFQTEYHFLGGSYSTNLLNARCSVKTFIDDIAVLGVQFYNFWIAIINNYNMLIQMADAFKGSNDLTCPLIVFGEGCEAKLSARRCELASFLGELIPMLKKGVADITKVQAGQADLGKLIDSFTSKNNITCSGSGSEADYCLFKAVVNEFFVCFNNIHWQNLHFYYIDFQFICDQITARTSTLFVKCNCT